MNPEPHIATESQPRSKVREDGSGTPAGRVTASTILQLAVWFGLLAGFIDLGLLVLIRKWIQGDFFRTGGHFAWLVPLAVTFVVLVPAIVLVLIARLRGGSVRLGLVVGLLSFVGLLDVSGRLPLEAWSAVLLSGGIATQLARLMNRRQSRFLGIVRRTLPMLGGAWLAFMLTTIGGRAWEDYRARIALPAPPPHGKNVLLIVWDTVRWGNLSLNGYSRSTTPNLKRLARIGTRFDMAFSASSWTLPAHASLFTGRWPHELGVDWKSPLRDDVPTLAGYLAAQGYDTAGFVANLDYCNRETGLARGFAHYEDFPLEPFDILRRYTALGSRVDVPDLACLISAIARKITGRWYDLVPRSNEHAKSAAVVNRDFLAWLSRRTDRGRPFFAFLNYNDAHTPYEVPDHAVPAFGLRPASSWDRLSLHNWTTVDKATLSYHDVRMAIDVYDDCIAYLDARLESLLEALRQRGQLDDTVLVFASDHGEHLGDHLLFFHGCSLYRQVVQVPLLIVDRAHVPAGRVVSEPVSLRDVPATVVDLLGGDRANPFPGRSLARYWSRDAVPRDETRVEPLLMETGKPSLLANQGREPASKGRMNAMVAGGMHYIRSGDGSEELYSLKSDPDEKFNMAGSTIAREIVEGFRNRLAAMLSTR